MALLLRCAVCHDSLMRFAGFGPIAVSAWSTTGRSQPAFGEERGANAPDSSGLAHRLDALVLFEFLPALLRSCRLRRSHRRASSCPHGPPLRFRIGGHKDQNVMLILACPRTV